MPITQDNPLQEFHLDRTQLSTSAPHPPFASMVEPNYGNVLVHGIGIPTMQTSLLDHVGLKYCITRIFRVEECFAIYENLDFARNFPPAK